MLQGIQEVDRAKWEMEISHAEEIRLQDRTAMDILGAKEINDTAAPGEVEDIDNIVSDIDWIQLALTIEEKQFVIYTFWPFGNVTLLLSGLKFEIVFAGRHWFQMKTIRGMLTRCVRL